MYYINKRNFNYEKIAFSKTLLSTKILLVPPKCKIIISLTTKIKFFQYCHIKKKAKNFKSDNYTKSNRGKFNISVTILEKELLRILGALIRLPQLYYLYILLTFTI